ncbi:MAG: hypothetical protein ACLFRD_10060 [Nitriliruptoraceae bacterium]
MDVLQTWILIGVPGLVVAGGLFVGRDRRRALLGYVVLLALIATFVTVPGGGFFAALVGLIGVVLVATGRGTDLDDREGEHHEQRRSFTTAERG